MVNKPIKEKDFYKFKKSLEYIGMTTNDLTNLKGIDSVVAKLVKTISDLSATIKVMEKKIEEQSLQIEDFRKGVNIQHEEALNREAMTNYAQILVEEMMTGVEHKEGGEN